MKLALLLLGTLLLLLLFSDGLDAEHHRHHRGQHEKEVSKQEEETAVISGHKSGHKHHHHHHHDHSHHHGQNKSKHHHHHHHHGKGSEHEHGKKDSKHSKHHHHHPHSKDNKARNLDTYTRHKPCDDKIPGIDKMAKGVDINSLDLFPSDKTASNGFLDSIFEFTCDRNFTYTDPTSKKVYQRPDQVHSISSNPSGSETVTTSIHNTLDDVRSSMAAKAGIDLNAGHSGGPQFGFSASASYKQAKTSLLVKKQSVAETSEFRTSYIVEFKDAEQMRLTHHFKKTLKKLPHNFFHKPGAYQNFLSTFGTHYFKSASFGGSLYLRTMIESSFATETNEHEIKAALAAKLKFGFFSAKANVEGQVSESKKTETFDQKSETTFLYFGGKTNPQKTDAIDQWYATVNEDPWLYAGRVAPIEELIRDDRKRDQVEIAILWFGMKKTIEDLENTINIGILYRSQATKFREALKNITTYLEKPDKVKGGRKEVVKKAFEVKELGKQLQMEMTNRTPHKEVAVYPS